MMMILNPQNPSPAKNDLSSQCAAVMCFLLQVLIHKAVHALHTDLFQAFRVAIWFSVTPAVCDLHFHFGRRLLFKQCRKVMV